MCCIIELQSWCSSCHLQLNVTKTELIWFGSCTTLRRGLLNGPSLTTGFAVIQAINIIRYLGVLLDRELTIKQHDNHVTSICFYHIRQLRQLRRLVSQAAMKQLMSAVILSRLDYCNSVLARLPLSTLAPLQRAQNATTRIILGLSPRDHVRPALRELHWLPIIYHIKFKIFLLMYLADMHWCPLYMSQTLSSVSNNPFSQWLR